MNLAFIWSLDTSPAECEPFNQTTTALFHNICDNTDGSASLYVQVRMIYQRFTPALQH